MAEPARALGARHLVLLGLPGAGKSTIGPLVARALGREFVDLDAAIEAREGRTVLEIFASAGEAASAVYLRVSVAVALARMGATVTSRPLLAGADPAVKLDELLRRRGPFYLQAEYTLSSDSMTPEAAASSIVALASGSRPD